jgi:hypothetical protein
MKKVGEEGRIESLTKVKFPLLVESSRTLLKETNVSTPFNPNSNGHLLSFSKINVQSVSLRVFED